MEVKWIWSVDVIPALADQEIGPVEWRIDSL
jgi:hypothetical protein